MPAKAGIQVFKEFARCAREPFKALDSRFRGNDNNPMGQPPTSTRRRRQHKTIARYRKKTTKNQKSVVENPAIW
jgi:hypothetical protein